jgi:hypothetical protein
MVLSEQIHVRPTGARYKVIVTDRLRSYGEAMRAIGNADRR